MSYMSGIMMGMALGKGVRQFLGGGAGQSFFGGQGGSRGGQSFFGGQGGGQGGRRGKGGGQAPEAQPSRRGGAAQSAMTLASATPGRRRYYACALAGNAPLAEAVEQALSRLPFIDEARANPATGSLLLLYHGDEAAVDAVAARLASRVFRNPGAAGPFAAAGEDLAAVGQSLRGTASALSRKVSALTNGWFDLPSLLSLFFAVQGVQKILLAKQLPSGPQLLWWAFSLLRGWRVA